MVIAFCRTADPCATGTDAPELATANTRCHTCTSDRAGLSDGDLGAPAVAMQSGDVLLPRIGHDLLLLCCCKVRLG
jgi:hypothetical protein